MALSASFEYLCYGSTVIINTEDLVIFACLNFREYLILGLHCHYYKTKFEVSGEDAHLNFSTSLYLIQNDRKSAIIYLDWPDIG